MRKPIAFCTICDTPSPRIAEHPEAFIHRCPGCTHCFSVLKDAAGSEPYDDRYYEDENRRWFENPNIKLFERIAQGTLSKGEKLSVLDVGCGRGDFLHYLRRTYSGLTLTGIELTEPPAVEGIRFLKGDAVTTHVDGSFDVVVSLAVIEHIPERQGIRPPVGRSLSARRRDLRDDDQRSERALRFGPCRSPGWCTARVQPTVQASSRAALHDPITR